MMAGNITAIFVGACAAIIVSLCTRGRMTAEEVEAEWEKTRDIDNPLNPWVEVYKGKNKSIIGLVLSGCSPPMAIRVVEFLSGGVQN